jgi:CheY-like chemotaxis protein
MARHVLLVDDDPELTLAVDRQLAELGYDAVVVASGEDALRVLGEDLRVDVLLTALRLPDIDGRELAWAACRTRPFVRVAFMAHDPRGELSDVRDAPVLMKPFSATALATALLQAVPLRKSIRDEGDAYERL